MLNRVLGYIIVVFYKDTDDKKMLRYYGFFRHLYWHKPAATCNRNFAKSQSRSEGAKLENNGVESLSCKYPQTMQAVFKIRLW